MASCTKADQGYFLRDGVPVRKCPNGQKGQINGRCKYKETEFKANFLFDQFLDEWESNGVKLVGDSKTPSDKRNKMNYPLPIYQRGVHFNLFRYFEIQNFVLNHSFTIQFWIKPYQRAEAKDMSLFSIEASTPAFYTTGLTL